MARFDKAREENFGPITSRLYSLLSGIFLESSIYKFAADDILRSKARKILDIGTGPATIPIKVASQSDRVEIYAIDPSKDMLRIASKKAKDSGIHFAEGHSLHVPFHTKFDLITSSISFHHWAHKKESLEYLSQFLNRDGEIRIYEFRKIGHLPIQAKHSMTKEELRGAAEGTGLRVKEIIEKKNKLRASYVKNR